MKFLTHEERVWQPVHVKSRCEKKFNLFCGQTGIASYLPLKIHMNTVRSKIMRSMVPMFRGYTFACLDHNLRERLTHSGLVVHYIHMTPSTEISLIEDLKSIVILEKMQGENETLYVEPELKPGIEVNVKTGPMRGLTGVIEKRKGVHRIIVNVEIINQSVTLEIDACDVEMEF